MVGDKQKNGAQNEIIMLRWVSGVIGEDKKRNEYIRIMIGVTLIIEGV